MSENEPPEVPATALGPVRPLSIRISDGLRAQLEVIAQLNDRSVTDEIRLALEACVETSKSDPKVLERASTVRVPAGLVTRGPRPPLRGRHHPGERAIRHVTVGRTQRCGSDRHRG